MTTLISFLVLGQTLAPDLTWAHWGGDGPELITAAATLGIPHPPGYPAYVLLGKLFSLLPLGSVAYRFNLFSAVSIALAAGFLTLLASRLTPHLSSLIPHPSPLIPHPSSLTPHPSSLIPHPSSLIPHPSSLIPHPSSLIPHPSSLIPHPSSLITHPSLPAIATGLSFAFAPLVWSQAVIAEVYGLNLLFLAVCLWGLGAKRPFLAGLFLGLATTAHLTSLLMLPLVLITAQRKGAKEQRVRKRLVWVGGGLILGLTPFLALPLLAQSDGPIIWGRPDTLRGWWWIVSGRIYHANLFAGGWAQTWTQAKVITQQIAIQFTPVGLPLIAAGLFLQSPISNLFPTAGARQAEDTAPRENNPPVSPAPPLPTDHRLPITGYRIPLTASLYLLYAALYHTHDFLVFTLPALLLLSLLLLPTLSRLKWWSLLLPAALLLLHFNGHNLSQDHVVRPDAESLLAQAPQGAILLAPGDQTISTLWYSQAVESQRPDLILVDANLFAFAWYRERLAQHHPDLVHLAMDDLAGFERENGKERPFCHAALVNKPMLTCE